MRPGSLISAPMVPVSIVIPAHNEQQVISRCLRALTTGSEPGELEIVVACNGCTDGTAEVVRAGWPDATVVEVVAASKHGALNAGDRRSTRFPRFYIDADVEVGIDAVRETARLLAAGRADCAAPRPSFELAGRPRTICRFYDTWQRLPYLRGQVVGNGVYALSEKGRSRFRSFPPLTADDQFVLQRFDEDERLAVDLPFTVHTPMAISGLIRMRTRVYRGNRELAASHLAAHDVAGGGGRAAVGLLLRPRLATGAAVYLVVNAWAKMNARRSRRRPPVWERDDSARQLAGQATQARQLAGLVANPRHATGALRVAYLVARYPSISHTFVLREVQGVRRAGGHVRTMAVRRAEPDDILSEADVDEAASTWSVRPLGVVGLAWPHLCALVRAPAAYGATLRLALSVSPPGARARLWQLFYFVEAIIVWHRCARDEVHHLHAHLANVAADLAWLAAAFGARADPVAGWRWSFTMHGPTEFSAPSSFNLARKVRHADAVICISEFCRSQLMALVDPECWGKLKVAHCGVDLERYRPGQVPPEAREAEAREGGSPLELLCVGRLVPEKGQSVLLHAIARARTDGVAVRATIVGGGPDATRLRELAQRLNLVDAVRFTGPLGQDDLPGIFALSDAFCLPSFAEGVPVVLMEAMASGLPVVTTPIAGIPELVDHGVSGFLVRPGRSEELAAALGALAADPARRAAMGRAGRAKVAAEFDAASCGRRVADLLAGVRR